MVKDHLGNEFKTRISMCKYYGLKEGTFNERIKRGYNLERALTERIGKGVGKSKKCYDHLGKEFSCVDEMLIHYERSKTAYYHALGCGRSLEEALTGYENKPAQCSLDARTDHAGNIYESVRDMCEAYDVSVDAYKGRMKRGWSKERALTFKNDIGIKKKIEDSCGNRFNNQKEMCKFYGVTYEAFRGRLSRGCNIKAAISKITDYDINGLKIIREVYQDEEGIFYYLCSNGNSEDIMSGYEVLIYGR